MEQGEYAHEGQNLEERGTIAQVRNSGDRPCEVKGRKKRKKGVGFFALGF